MKKILTTALKISGFFAFGFTILYLVYNKTRKAYLEDCVSQGNEAENCDLIDKVINDFQGANYWWLLGIIVVFMISNVSRAFRWQMLFKPLGVSVSFLNSFFAIMVGYLTNLGIPRAGELVRGGIVSRYHDVSLEQTMGTIVVDRIMDFLCLGIFVILALSFEYELITDKLGGAMDKYKALGPTLLIIVALGVTGLAASYFFRERLMKYALFQKITKILKGFAEGIATVRSIKRIWLFLLHTVIIWVCYYLMTYLCFFSFEPTSALGLREGLTIFLMGAIGMIIPSPGGMGSYHAMLMAGLAIYGIEQFDGFSYANLIFFTVTIFGNILFGLLGLLVLPLHNRKSIQSAKNQREDI